MILKTSIRKKIILFALNEDLKASGDITSECLIKKNYKSKFYLYANDNGILAGIKIFIDSFKLIDKNIKISTKYKDGDKVKKNSQVATVFGNTINILKAERTALNFICHLSGIATLTKQFINLIKDTNIILLDTRKTTPGLRLFEKEAVIIGGGRNHRFNLSEMVLIKDNHITASGGINKAIKKAKEKYENKTLIEVEVENIQQLKDAISARPDIIMFDNWKVHDLKKAIKFVPDDILTEVSGQITPENIRTYAKCNVNCISTSYMVKNSRWIDFSLIEYYPKKTRDEI